MSFCSAALFSAEEFISEKVSFLFPEQAGSIAGSQDFMAWLKCTLNYVSRRSKKGLYAQHNEADD